MATFCVEHRTLFCQIFPLSNNLEYPVFHGVMGDGHTVYSILWCSSSFDSEDTLQTQVCLLEEILLFGYSYQDTDST